MIFIYKKKVNVQTRTRKRHWIGSVDWHMNLTFSLGKTVISGWFGVINGAASSECSAERMIKIEKLWNESVPLIRIEDIFIENLVDVSNEILVRSAMNFPFVAISVFWTHKIWLFLQFLKSNGQLDILHN